MLRFEKKYTPFFLKGVAASPSVLARFPQTTSEVWHVFGQQAVFETVIDGGKKKNPSIVFFHLVSSREFDRASGEGGGGVRGWGEGVAAQKDFGPTPFIQFISLSMQACTLRVYYECCRAFIHAFCFSSLSLFFFALKLLSASVFTANESIGPRLKI